jgi:hypothetical protein
MALSSTYRYTGVSDETADDARQKTIANMF